LSLNLERVGANSAPTTAQQRKACVEAFGAQTWSVVDGLILADMPQEQKVERHKFGQLSSWNFWSDRAKEAFSTWGFQEQSVDNAAVKQSRSKVYFNVVCGRFVYLCAACEHQKSCFYF